MARFLKKDSLFFNLKQRPVKQSSVHVQCAIADLLKMGLSESHGDCPEGTTLDQRTNQPHDGVAKTIEIDFDLFFFVLSVFLVRFSHYIEATIKSNSRSTRYPYLPIKETIPLPSNQREHDDSRRGKRADKKQECYDMRK
jgi:hypothetical protein